MQVGTSLKEIRKLDVGFGGFISLELFPKLLHENIFLRSFVRFWRRFK